MPVRHGGRGGVGQRAGVLLALDPLNTTVTEGRWLGVFNGPQAISGIGLIHTPAGRWRSPPEQTVGIGIDTGGGTVANIDFTVRVRFR